MSATLPDAHDLRAADRTRGLALSLLVKLRWFAVGGQAGLLLVARVVFQVDLPYTEMWSVVAVAGATNLALQLRQPRSQPAMLLPGLLLLDTALLTVLLALSGGPHNPFTALYVVHVALAAVAMDVRGTAAVAALSAAAYALLFRWHVPQPLWEHAGHGGGGLLSPHLLGMWLALAVVAGLIAYFITRLSEQLAAARARAARNERLASVTTLAAGTAHELGSPLGTIAVAAHEIERAAKGEIRDDARLIAQEVKRCREILDRMSGAAPIDDPFVELDAEGLVETLRSALGESATRVVSRVAPRIGPIVAPRQALVQALLVLARNALEASTEEVDLEIDHSDGRIRFRVSDRGSGMSAEVLAHAGDPFFTTKEPGRGTGLGLYFVRLIAERMGGDLDLRSAHGKGTDATLSLPRRAEVSG